MKRERVNLTEYRIAPDSAPELTAFVVVRLGDGLPHVRFHASSRPDGDHTTKDLRDLAAMFAGAADALDDGEGWF